jgi:hypothetical protein
MPRGRKEDRQTLTDQQEVRAPLQWAEQVQFENIAAALCRALAKLPVSQTVVSSPAPQHCL